MKEKEIKVLCVESDKAPYVKVVDQSLESLQKEVGGYIECCYPFDEPVCIICNEEGKIMGLPLNRPLFDDDGQMYDIIAGTFLIAGTADEYFESLNDEFIAKYTDMFKTPMLFVRAGREIKAVPVTAAVQ